VGDGGAVFDRVAFCRAIAAESQRALATLPRLAAKVADDPKRFDAMLAPHRRALGACVGSPKSAWAIALERLSAGNEGVLGTWSLVHAVAGGGDVRLRPWPFEPKDKAQSANFELGEFDYVLGAPAVNHSFDWDGDGDEEVLLLSSSSGHETGSSQMGLFTFKQGAIVPYAPARGLDVQTVKDVDGDGRPDLLTSGPYDDVTSDMGGGFFEVRLLEGLFVAHSLPDGTFSLGDPVARRSVARWCTSSVRLVFQPEGGSSDASVTEAPLDEDAVRKRVAQSVVCARIRGRSAASVAAAIRTGCPRDAQNEGEAPDAAPLGEGQRPYCYERARMLAWAAQEPPLRLP